MSFINSIKTTWSVYPIKAGEFGPMPYWMAYRNGEKAGYGYNIPSIIYLLQRGNKNILIDTSFSSEEEVSRNMGIYCRRDRPIDLCLSAYDVSVEQIHIVILTHLHWDHAGNMDMFPNAEFICQDLEYKWLTKFYEWEIGYPQWCVDTILRNKERLKLINGDIMIEDGLEVWLQGGHTPGSQMVAVKTEKGLCVITGDNAMTYKNVENNIPVGLFCNIHECIHAIERINMDASFFIPSHDWEVFKRIET